MCLQAPPPRPLYKQQSWSPDTPWEKAWQRRKENRHRLSKSLTDDDIEELKGFIDLGFGFDSAEIDPRLLKIIPALKLYYAVHKQYKNYTESSSSSPLVFDTDIADPGDDLAAQKKETRFKQWAQLVACAVQQSSPTPIFYPGDDLAAQKKKTRFKQWAQVVACAVQQSSPTPIFNPGDDLAKKKKKKTRFEQWAQVVTCVVRNLLHLCLHNK